MKLFKALAGLSIISITFLFLLTPILNKNYQESDDAFCQFPEFEGCYYTGYNLIDAGDFDLLQDINKFNMNHGSRIWIDGEMQFTDKLTADYINFYINSFAVLPNHVYYYQNDFILNGEVISNIKIYPINGTYVDVLDGQIIDDSTFSTLFVASANTYLHAYIYTDGIDISFNIDNFLFYDLTEIFGSGNEPTYDEFVIMLNRGSTELYNDGVLVNKGEYFNAFKIFKPCILTLAENQINLLSEEITTNEYIGIEISPYQKYTLSYTNIIDATIWRLSFILYKDGVVIDATDNYSQFTPAIFYYNSPSYGYIWGGDATHLYSSFEGIDADYIEIRLFNGDVSPTTISYQGQFELNEETYYKNYSEPCLSWIDVGYDIIDAYRGFILFGWIPFVDTYGDDVNYDPVASTIDFVQQVLGIDGMVEMGEDIFFMVDTFFEIRLPSLVDDITDGLTDIFDDLNVVKRMVDVFFNDKIPKLIDSLKFWE